MSWEKRKQMRFFGWIMIMFVSLGIAATLAAPDTKIAKPGISVEWTRFHITESQCELELTIRNQLGIRMLLMATRNPIPFSLDSATGNVFTGWSLSGRSYGTTRFAAPEMTTRELNPGDAATLMVIIPSHADEFMLELGYIEESAKDSYSIGLSLNGSRTYQNIRSFSRIVETLELWVLEDQHRGHKLFSREISP